MKLPKDHRRWVTYKDSSGKARFVVTSDQMRTMYFLWKVLPGGEFVKVKQSKSPVGFQRIVEEENK